MEYMNSMGLVDMVIQGVDAVGYVAPKTLSILALYFLRNHSKYFVMFVLGYVVNYYTNKYLKSVFKQPRPSDQIRNPLFEKNIKDGHESENKYGMPSGHAQRCFFAIGYVYWVRRSKNILFPMLLLGGISLYQGLKYRRHTVEQLVAGSLIGITLSYVFFLGANVLK